VDNFYFPTHAPTPLSIQIRHRQLQNRREDYPEKIRNLDISYPAHVRKDGQHRPDESGKDKKDIQRGQIIIFESELDRRKSQVENKIEDERQNDHSWDIPLPGHDENFAEGNGNEDIKKRPNRAKKPGRRRPRRFYQLLIPSDSFHA
jgi:hypothetical protein